MKKMCSTMMMILLAICIFGGGNVEAAVVNALPEEGETIVQPFYEDTKKADVTLSITDGVVTATTNVTTLRKCDISITMKLQKKSGDYWLTIKTWTGSATSATGLKLSKTYNVPSGSYRVSSTIVSGADTITKNSATKTAQ